MSTKIQNLQNFINKAKAANDVLEAYTEQRFGRLWIEVYNLSNGQKITVHEGTWVDYKATENAEQIDIIC
jgi:hypothetical protein